MSTKIKNLLSKVKEINEGLESGEFFKDVILDNEAYILDLNTEEQLYTKGITREGVPISAYAPYSPYTVTMKKQKGQPYDRVTLRDEGDFHRSFFLQVYPDRFVFFANDAKALKLIRLYGIEIMGLTEENFKEVKNSYVVPEIKNKINKIING